MIVNQASNSTIIRTFSLVFPILFILFLGISSSYSQLIAPKPIFNQFTVDDGLPSNEIYHIIQDSTGYIWIATANGISRFDGYTFKNYGLEDGLIESTIHEIFIDYKNRIWFIANSGKLTFFEKERINAYPYNHRINDYVDKSRGTVKKSFYVDSLDNVTLSLKGNGKITISSEGIVKHYQDLKEESIIDINELPDETIIVTNHMLLTDKKISFLSEHSSYNFTTQDMGFKAQGAFHFFFLKEKLNSYIMTIKGTVFGIEDGKILERKKIGFDIIWASFDKDNNLWLAPIEGGVIFYKDGDFLREGIHLLENETITSVKQDRENGYWFSSLTSGIFYCSNINSHTYNEETGLPSNRVTSVFYNRDGLFIGNEKGIVSNIKDRKITNHNMNTDPNTPSPIRFLGIDSTSTKVWIGSSNYLYSIDGAKIEYFFFSGTARGIYPRQVIPSSDGQYWIASSWGIRKFDGKSCSYNSRILNEFSGLVYSVYEDSTGALWMGAVNGIWKYENKSFNYLGEKNTYYTHPSSHITKGPNGTILIATRGIGLIIKDGEVIKKISQSDGLNSNYINRILVDESGIWLATSNGINLIQGDISNNYSIKSINKSYGLPTNEVNSIYICSNNIYMGSSKGVTVINKKDIKVNEVKPIVKITNVRVRDNDIDITTNHINLDYDQNYISIDFVGLAYKNMGKPNYRYRLKGLDSLWIYTTSTNSTYSGLKYGKYIFEVKAQNSDKIWGDSSSFSISISPPYWQTYWFIILSTVVFSLLIFLIYRNRISGIRRRNELVNNLNIYKQQSLRQQMNPHFIFNTLNSIQLYILEKDHISSHKYLTKFAKLMRLVLDNSQQSTITLKDEIDALKLYLELESIRLSGKFEYFIEIENNDLLNCQIPTLLIQPFVENSIWHGIMLKPEQDGWVKINIKSSNESIKCTIEDNGVGRVKAQSIRSKQEVERKSLGFRITAQRIELLNSLYKEKFSIIYTDLNSPEGEPLGTRVELLIPYSVNQEHSNQQRDY